MDKGATKSHDVSIAYRFWCSLYALGCLCGRCVVHVSSRFGVYTNMQISAVICGAPGGGHHQQTGWHSVTTNNNCVYGAPTRFLHSFETAVNRCQWRKLYTRQISKAPRLSASFDDVHHHHNPFLASPRHVWLYLCVYFGSRRTDVIWN